MSDNMSEENGGRYARKRAGKNARRMSEDLQENMSEQTAIGMSGYLSEKTVRKYVRKRC